MEGKISNIFWWGLPSREFSIEISPDDLIRYKLTVGDIASAIRNASLNLSSGSVLTDQEEILIRTYEKKYEAIDFETIEVVSSIDGRKILLRDICTVVEQWPENRLYSEYYSKDDRGVRDEAEDHKPMSSRLRNITLVVGQSGWRPS